MRKVTMNTNMCYAYSCVSCAFCLVRVFQVSYVSDLSIRISLYLTKTVLNIDVAYREGKDSQWFVLTERLQEPRYEISER